MASNTQPQTLSDLRTDFLGRVRDATGVTAINTLVDRYLNIALHDMHTAPGHNFPWLVRRATLLTHAIYTTGTISITTAARTTVTGSSTTWNTAVTGYGFNNARAGGKIYAGANNEVLDVSSVGSDTAITLANRWTGTTDVSAQSYTYFEDEYALASDFHRLADMRSFSTDLDIPVIGPRDFRRRFTRNTTFGRPCMASVIQLGFATSASPRYRVVLHPAPDLVYAIPYDYITTNLAVTTAGVEQSDLTATDDEPIVPLKYRHVIVYGALYHWYRDRKDDTRSQEVKGEYTDLVRRMLADVKDRNDDRPRIQPHSSIYRSPTSRGRFDVGNRFDEMRW